MGLPAKSVGLVELNSRECSDINLADGANASRIAVGSADVSSIRDAARGAVGPGRADASLHRRTECEVVREPLLGLRPLESTVANHPIVTGAFHLVA